MTALLRRDAAPASPAPRFLDGTIPRHDPPPLRLADDGRPDPALWPRVVEIRRQWLALGLSTEPADRTVAEHLIAGLYARCSRHRPRFVWVDSPRQALPLLTGLPTHRVLQDWIMARQPVGIPPVASDLAAGLSRLRGALDAAATHPDLAPPAPARKGQKPPPPMPPEEALRAGVPLREVLRQGVRAALRTSLADNFYLPVRAALARSGSGAPVPVAWYGQQDSWWIAYYDVLRRLGLARYRPADEAQLDDWALLASAGGWWWPGDEVCVLVDRPAVIRTRPVAGAWHEEVRPDHSGPPAVEYRDGWRPLPTPDAVSSR